MCYLFSCQYFTNEIVYVARKDYKQLLNRWFVQGLAHVQVASRGSDSVWSPCSARQWSSHPVLARLTSYL